MVSELFTELYHKAMRREHPKLVTAMGIYRYLGGEGNFLHLGRSAEGVNIAAQDFDNRLHEVAQRQRMRALPHTLQCPICGLAHCPEAQLVIRLHPSQVQYLKHLLDGGDPHQYEDLGT